VTEIKTPSTHVQSVELSRAGTWLRSNAVVITALALIAVSLWWKAILLSHSFFRFDDFIYLNRAAHNGFSWTYLMWVDAGHLTPLGDVIAWFLAKISPADWALTSAATLVLLAIACLALLRMLRTFFGDHPGILVLVAVYVLSPLALSGLSWWTVTLELLPLQAATFFAITAHVHYLRTGRRSHALAAGVWLFVAMASSFRGAAVPLLLLALTSGFFGEGSWLRATAVALRERWGAWLLYLVITAAYLVTYVRQLATSSVAPGRPGSFSGVLQFALTQLKDNFVPGSLGGPWRWIGAGVYAAANPPVVLAAASWVIAAAIVLVSIFYRPKAWRAWAILTGWLLVVDMVPVVLGRASFVPGVLLGLVTRYVWDATGIVALCLGLAFLPLVGEAKRRAHGQRHTYGQQYYRPLRTAAVCVITAMVIGSVWSFYSYPTDPGAAVGRSYVATARIALAQAPSGTVIVDDPIPADVVGGQYVDTTALASSLLTPLINGPQHIKPKFITQPHGTYRHLMEFDGWGRLVPSVISGPSSPPPPAGRSCWSAHSGTVQVKLFGTAKHATMLQIGYLVGTRGRILVKFGGQTLLYNYSRGFNQAYLPVHGSGDSVEIERVSGRMPCIGSVKAGALLPSTTGKAIPQLAVNG
jgi:hypothetical protein